MASTSKTSKKQQQHMYMIYRVYTMKKVTCISVIRDTIYCCYQQNMCMSLFLFSLLLFPAGF